MPLKLVKETGVIGGSTIILACLALCIVIVYQYVTIKPVKITNRGYRTLHKCLINLHNKTFKHVNRFLLYEKIIENALVHMYASQDFQLDHMVLLPH